MTPPDGKPCPKCSVGKPVHKHNMSPASWLECDHCDFKVGPWIETWNEVAALVRPIAINPPDGDRILKRTLADVVLGLRQVRYILKSVANGDDQREVAGKAAEIVEGAIDAFSSRLPQGGDEVEQIRQLVDQGTDPGDRHPFIDEALARLSALTAGERAGGEEAS